MEPTDPSANVDEPMRVTVAYSMRSNASVKR